MSRTRRSITTPNRAAYMQQVHNHYYTPQDKKPIVQPQSKLIVIALVFLFVGLGIGYLTYPFLDTADWVTAEQIGAEVVPTVEQTLASIDPAEVVAYVNKHKDLFPSLVQPAKTEAPKAEAPKPAKTKEQLQKEANDATVKVLSNDGDVRVFKITYLPQYYNKLVDAHEVDFGDSKSKRVQDLKTKYVGDSVLLTWKLRDGTEASAKIDPDGKVHWLANRGYDMLNVERAIQLIVDSTRRDSCVNDSN